MLVLRDIRKTYPVGEGETVQALRGVDLTLRRSEFVAVLGPSGCGKTTLLNIIGGLDRYSAGDLVIDGVSTKEYTERDWDGYRNHSIGFVFQSYNLIPHQTVLANVELALTISGVGKGERRRRAEEALRRVGLADQMKKKPNQLSGGQMQRVAIARALVNDPEIVLADEPTGALDSGTSVQIMELLKEVARDRLVVMVTHNPDLAAAYATRVVRLLDGRVVSDSRPCAEDEERAEREAARGAAAAKRPSMSFATALALSFNNLMTKKGRTLMVAFAGSIGIIGIALILSLSTGVQAYIDSIEAEALSSYPISIQAESADSAALLESFLGMREEFEKEPEPGVVTTNTVMAQMYNAMLSGTRRNDLAAFKEYIDSTPEFASLAGAVQYGYASAMTVFHTDGEAQQVYPNTVMDSMFSTGGLGFSSAMMSAQESEFWQELPGDERLWKAQFTLAAGRWPQAAEDVLLVIDSHQRISDLALYSQGLKDQSTLAGQFFSMMRGEETSSENLVFTYDQLMDLQFTALPAAECFVRDEETGLFGDARASGGVEALLEDGVRLRVCGIVMMKEEGVSRMMSGTMLYTSALTDVILARVRESAAVLAQEAACVDVTTGLLLTDAAWDEARAFAADSGVLPERLAVIDAMPESTRVAALRATMPQLFSDVSRAQALAAIGALDESAPGSIRIYPKDFEAKDRIVALIDAYNDGVTAAGEADKEIRYTDYVGLLMTSVSTIVNAITWVLVAFVAISLVVSSIMIGVITYISVLERTKEIGILRSIGASRRDISRVFNAETLVIGLAAGAIGVLVAWLCTIPASAIVYRLSGIERIAQLPPLGAALLVAASMAMTLVAGLIPARIASRRDPVVALRAE